MVYQAYTYAKIIFVTVLPHKVNSPHYKWQKPELSTGFKVVLMLLLPHVMWAQTKFYAQLSESHVYMNRAFQVQYVIEGAKRINEFHYPDFGGLSVEEEFEIPNTIDENNNLLKSYSKVAVLSASKQGTYNIPPATAIVDGKLLKSNMLIVSVHQPDFKNGQIPQEVQDESEILPGQTIEKKIKENFFLLSEVNKTSCYVGEPLMAVYKACSRLNANSQVVKRPSLTGFSVIEMVDGYDTRPEVEMINGKPFFVHLIRKVQLFPLQPGNYELEGAEVESVIHFTRNKTFTAEEELKRILGNNRDSRSNELVQHRLTLRSQPLEIIVRALPDSGQPADFAGAVGKFSIYAETENKGIEEGTLFTLALRITGTGNFPLITAPDIKWPEGVNAVAGRVEENTDPFIYPLSGSKTFYYTVSVNDKGEYDIPPVEFPYFDPSAEAYRTVSTGVVSFVVNEKKNERKNFTIPDTGIGVFSKVPRHYYFFSLIVIAIISWITYQVIFAGKKRKKQTIEKEIPAPVPTNPFDLADQALVSGNRREFYQCIQALLWNLAAERSGVLPSGLNKQNIASILRAKNVNEQTISGLLQLLNECELSLYTPDHSAADMLILRKKAQSLYDQLNSSFRK